ncbi:hypothetical protein FZC83_01840 [Rossellomorea marisflavi]|uniref:Uncharacterized protein n=1 Tax=Rossellomorea marisflavi TaxID=189381 RepID=A0A5D4RYC3_9BACI|nr:hypothetical protein [Rossellomorea marisflavi]TYS56337.1 hypothetical protein FZC83_01840 [Rossellomorea marisflavi]
MKGKLQRFYIHCETDREELNIKIKAKSEDEALTVLHKQYKVNRVIDIKTKQPMVKYETACSSNRRSLYPYVKNDNGKLTTIFT